MAAGAHSGAYKRIVKVVISPGHGAAAGLPVLRGPRGPVGLLGRRGGRASTDGDADDSTWTTLPETRTATRPGHPGSRPRGPGGRRGRAAPVPAATTGRPAGLRPDGHTGDGRLTGSSGGWERLDVDLSAYAGKVELSARGRHGPGHAGARRLGRQRVAHRRRRDGRATDFERTPAAGRRSAARGHGEPGERTGQAERACSSRAAWWPPTTRSTPGSASRASTRRADRVPPPHAGAPRRRGQPGGRRQPRGRASRGGEPGRPEGRARRSRSASGSASIARGA